VTTPIFTHGTGVTTGHRRLTAGPASRLSAATTTRQGRRYRPQARHRLDHPVTYRSVPTRGSGATVEDRTWWI